MPPKIKITKDAIIEKAFELTRLYGFEKVTARGIAAGLNCSTQPIFYAFHNMEDLKKEVYLKTRQFFEKEMLQPPADPDTPYFLSMGMKYVELAQKEKNLFRLLCMSDSVKMKSLYELAGQAPIEINRDVFVKTWIFTHGIASIVSTNTTEIPAEEIKKLLTEAGTGFYQYQQEKGVKK